MSDVSIETETLTVSKKRPRLDLSLTENGNKEFVTESLFSPKNTKLISVLGNDSHDKCIVLHVRFGETDSKDGILILKKSSFPSDPQKLKNSKVINHISINGDAELDSDGDKSETSEIFPCWQASSVMDNDIYKHFLVTAGLESVNDINMTVIYPAEAHHIQKYSFSGRHIVQETPDMYQSVVVPFLSEKVKDLTWVENIVNGEAELDRIIYSRPDPNNGFTLVLDYKWDGSKLNDFHCLGIVHNRQLTCLRDLRSSHVPLLKDILRIGREELVSKYSPNLKEDQIMAYMHYPPSFYWLHVHFTHVNASGSSGTSAARAHLLDEVIRNLEEVDNYYADRIMTIILHDNSPMLKVIQSKLNNHGDTDSNNNAELNKG